MKAKIYNLEGKEAGEQELNPKIFEYEVNNALIHQIVVAQQANIRKPYAHTKGRSDVRGGGRKPWRQKGTGRARHGSIRSPLWAGGGVTFGPTKERNFSKRINTKMNRKALLMVLSDKAADKKLILLDKLPEFKGKTKELTELLKKLPCANKKIFFALPKKNEKAQIAAHNLKKVWVQGVNNLNVLDLLKYTYLVTTVEGLAKMEKIFLKEDKKVKS